MTESELAALQALCDAADSGMTHRGHASDSEDGGRCDECRFYAAAMIHMPALIAEVRQLRAKRDIYKQAMESWRDEKHVSTCDPCSDLVDERDKLRAENRNLRVRLAGPAFDDEPDAPLHGECAAEIDRLRAENEALKADLSAMTELEMQAVDAAVKLRAENQKLQTHIDIELRAVMQISEKLRAAKAALDETRSLMMSRNNRNSAERATLEVVHTALGLLALDKVEAKP